MSWTTPTDTIETWGYWILRTGFWDVLGIWDDTDYWRDGAAVSYLTPSDAVESWSVTSAPSSSWVAQAAAESVWS